MTIVELLRHAKAGSRKDWSEGPDAQRPLTEEGWAQARALADELLAIDEPSVLLSSPLTRCWQTLEPLARRTHRGIVGADALAESPGVPVVDAGSLWVGAAWLGGRALGLIEELVASHPGERLVLCSHGDVIPATLSVLSGRDGLGMGEVHLKKGGRATLAFEDRRCTSVTFHPAPSVR